MTSENGTAAVVNDEQLLELDEQFPLHRAVFHNDLQKLDHLLSASTADNNIVDCTDIHGNTALHIGCMLGRRECVNSLLSHGASVQIKNNLGWSSFHEAVSYGDRKTIKSLMIALEKESTEQLKGHLPLLSEHLSRLADFYMESKWELSSWIPLLSRILPSDTVKIFKKGPRLRLDFTLTDFKYHGTMPKWERGDMSLLLDMTAADGRKALLMDNQKRVYQALKGKESGLRMSDELDFQMSGDIISTHMSTRPIHFVQAKSFLQFPKWDYVGEYKAYFYHIKRLQLITRKRREHLSQEDLKWNKEMKQWKQMFANGNVPTPDAAADQSCSDDDDASMAGCSDDAEGTGGSASDDSLYRPSLTPPPQPSISWSQYLRGSDELSHLGRPIQAKVSSKDFNGTLAMSTDFPLSLNIVLDILSMLEPVNPTMGKLRELCTARLPDGFPVRIDMPIFATIQARISFHHFRWCHGGHGAAPSLSAALFTIPDDYRENSKLTFFRSKSDSVDKPESKPP